MKKTIAFFVCLVMLFTALPIAVTAAEDELMPLSNNTSTCNATFNITAQGYATFTAKYCGYSGITTNGTITIQMQKKFLALFWRDVDDMYWEYSSNNVNYEVANTIQLSNTGTYRIIVNFTVYGTGGSADTFEKILEAKW